MTTNLDINGEPISSSEAEGLLRMLCNDAKKFAGEFHNMNRSEKFRQNWPDEYKFASANWKTFVEAVHQMYAQQLGDPKTSEHDKQRMFRAIVLWKRVGQLQEKDNRLQLMPNSQQFAGDPYENKKIIQKFGRTKNMRAHLLNSTATRH